MVPLSFRVGGAGLKQLKAANKPSAAPRAVAVGRSRRSAVAVHAAKFGSVKKVVLAYSGERSRLVTTATVDHSLTPGGGGEGRCA